MFFQQALQDGTRPPPPCPDALQAWRDSARTWACHLYAYAVPNSTALNALCQLSPLIEIGAGTGYWARLLKSRGADILALDIAPTNTSPNVYHGSAPSHGKVKHGGASELFKHSTRSLFLCYPPPNNPMALSCLEAYHGLRVAVVGEVDGDTGTTAFLRALVDQFTLERKVPLPNFGDTVYELTIWQRRANSESPRKHTVPLASCDTCKKADVPLLRCRYCREAVFCSAECERGGRDIHQMKHTARLIYTGPLMFQPGGRDYAPMDIPFTA